MYSVMVVAALLQFGSGAPAQTSGIDCAFVHMSPEGRRITGELAVLPPDETLAEPARIAGRDAVANCDAAILQDPARHRLVNSYTFERAVVEYANALLDEGGMGPVALEALWDRLPEDARATIVSFVDETDEGDAMGGLIAHLVEAGVEPVYESLKPAISGLCSLVAMRRAEAAWPG